MADTKAKAMKKLIRLGIVHSSTGLGLSIRPLDDNGGLLSIRNLRIDLAAAGYKAGDEVILISPEELSRHNTETSD